MRVLICGAGRIVVEVLRRLGQGWRVTVIDLNPDRLNELANELRIVHKTVQGDASSSVILERAGLQDQDYVLAMTGDDRVNLAVAAIAKSNKIPHVLSLVHDSDQIPAFHDLGVRILDLNSLLARTLVHYLQDPRIGITPLSHSGTEMFEKEACLQETVYLGRNLGLESMDVVCEYAHTELEGMDNEIMDIEQHRIDTRVESGLPDLCAKLNAGLAVMPGVRPSWLDFFRPPRLVKLAHRLACPLLMARGTFPYSSILVPFDGARESELALETASVQGLHYSSGSEHLPHRTLTV